MRNVLFAATGLMAAGLAFSAAPAHAATLPYSGVCPSTSGHAAVGNGSLGNATDCNLLIVFGAKGAITTYTGPQTTYNSTEDSLIGVVNNSGHALSSLNVSGKGIFFFDGSGGNSDGIDGYANIAINAKDAANTVNGWSGYGGPLGYFTNVSSTSFTGTDSGTVNFSTALTSGSGLQSGDNTYFSLEQAININQLPTVTNTAVPEPGTIAVLGTALLGLAGAVRRRSIG